MGAFSSIAQYVDTGNQDVAYLQIVKLDGGADERGFLFFERPVLFRFFHVGDDLIFRDHVVSLYAENLFQKFLVQGKEKGDRGQYNVENPNEGIQRHRHLLGRDFRQHLGGNFSENEHCHRHDRRRDDNGSVPVCDQLSEEHAGDRGRRNVDQVVPDQHGGDEFVVMIDKV